MNRSILLLLSLAALGSGCRKPMPSPDYIEASNRYSSLIAVSGDDAYLLPAMDGLVAQLERVPEKSLDYAAARALIATIASEKARVAKAPTTGVIPSPQVAPTFPEFAAPPPVQEKAVLAAIDAGTADLARGADFGAIQRKYVGCLISTGPISMQKEDGGSSETEGFELHDSESCRSRLPAMGKNVLVVEDGKVAYLLPSSTFKTVTTLTDGGKLPAP